MPTNCCCSCPECTYCVDGSNNPVDAPCCWTLEISGVTPCGCTKVFDDVGEPIGESTSPINYIGNSEYWASIISGDINGTIHCGRVTDGTAGAPCVWMGKLPSPITVGVWDNSSCSGTPLVTSTISFINIYAYGGPTPWNSGCLANNYRFGILCATGFVLSAPLDHIEKLLSIEVLNYFNNVIPNCVEGTFTPVTSCDFCMTYTPTSPDTFHHFQHTGHCGLTSGGTIVATHGGCPPPNFSSASSFESIGSESVSYSHGSESSSFSHGSHSSVPVTSSSSDSISHSSSSSFSHGSHSSARSASSHSSIFIPHSSSSSISTSSSVPSTCVHKFEAFYNCDTAKWDVEYLGAQCLSDIPYTLGSWIVVDSTSADYYTTGGPCSVVGDCSRIPATPDQPFWVPNCSQTCVNHWIANYDCESLEWVVEYETTTCMDPTDIELNAWIVNNDFQQDYFTTSGSCMGYLDCPSPGADPSPPETTPDCGHSCVYTYTSTWTCGGGWTTVTLSDTQCISTSGITFDTWTYDVHVDSQDVIATIYTKGNSCSDISSVGPCTETSIPAPPPDRTCCVFQYTTGYDCGGETFSDIVSEIICVAPDMVFDTWIRVGCNFTYYHLYGKECTSTDDCSGESESEAFAKPELPSAPPCPCGYCLTFWRCTENCDDHTFSSPSYFGQICGTAEDYATDTWTPIEITSNTVVYQFVQLGVACGTTTAGCDTPVAPSSPADIEGFTTACGGYYSSGGGCVYATDDFGDGSSVTLHFNCSASGFFSETTIIINGTTYTCIFQSDEFTATFTVDATPGSVAGMTWTGSWGEGYLPCCPDDTGTVIGGGGGARMGNLAHQWEPPPWYEIKLPKSAPAPVVAPKASIERKPCNCKRGKK